VVIRTAFWAGMLLLLAAAGGILHAAEGDVFTLLDDSNLRQGPDSSYASVGVAQEGDKAVELKTKGQWVKVRIAASGDEGWLYTNSLERGAPEAVTAQLPVGNAIAETPALNMSPLNTSPALAAGQTAIAPDVSVSDALNGDVAVAEAAGRPQHSAAVAPDMFVDGAVSSQPTPPVSVPAAKQGEAAVAGTASSAAVRQAVVAKEKPVPEPVAPAVTESAPLHTLTGATTAPEPVAPAIAAPKPSLPETVAQTQASGVHQVVETTTIRTGPGPSFDVLGWVGHGARVEAIEQQGDWWKVRLQSGGRTGWVNAALLKPVNVATGPVVMPVQTDAQAQAVPDVQTDQPGTVESGAVKPGAVKQAAALPVQGVEHLPPATVMSAPVSEAPVSEQASVSAGQPEVVAVKPVQVTEPVRSSEHISRTSERSLFSFNRKTNLRAGPGAKYDVVSWAGLGSYATELARTGDWVRVQMQVSKRIGWVYNRSLDMVKAGLVLPAVTLASDQTRTEPVVRVSTRTAKAKASDGLFTFRQTSNLHAGPGKQYDIIAWGGKHESAQVIAQQGDWRKVRMTVSGRVGWVFNSLLVKSGVDRAAVAVAAKPADTIQTGEIYEALRTEPLRANAARFAELTDWVSRGEAVALLEQRQGWMRVKPQNAEKRAGWIRADLLKRTGMTSTKVPHDGKLPGADRVVEYQDRISKGKTFNFSYAALEQALYRIPIEDIHVRIGKDDLNALFRKDTYDKSSFEIRLRTGRRHLQGRIQVLGSSTRIFKKKSLLIKLDKESMRWYGRRRIALRSMASDKALMREWMAWKLLAAMGATVPEVHFTRVSFNHGEKTGLYLSIEWMGRQFLAANHLDPRGGFYQPNDASHCGDLNSSENLDACFDKIMPRDGDYSKLSAMAKAVSSAHNDDMDTVLAQYFDDESVLNWIAANALVTNGDTYNKNYWLHYSPARNKWTVIPWDYNLTFGRVYDPFANRLNEQPFRIFNDNFQYFFPPDVGASNPLKDKTVRNPRLRARLETKLKHLLGLEPNGPEETFGWFSPTVMQARIGNLAAVVGKEVYKDTFLTFGEEAFTKTYESLMHYVTAHDYYLAAKLQGPFIWQPSPAFDPTKPPVLEPLPKELYGHGFIDAGEQSLHMTDQGWGYFVARLDFDAALKKKAEFKVNVAGGTIPKYLPVGQSPRRCIQRSWLLSTQTPDFTADGSLMVEYIQENSVRTEVPETLHEELLELWELDGHHWKPLKTQVNEYSNTLTATGVHLESGHTLRFVACSPF